VVWWPSQAAVIFSDHSADGGVYVASGYKSGTQRGTISPTPDVRFLVLDDGTEQVFWSTPLGLWQAIKVGPGYRTTHVVQAEAGAFWPLAKDSSSVYYFDSLSNYVYRVPLLGDGAAPQPEVVGPVIGPPLNVALGDSLLYWTTGDVVMCLAK
jgi:hypothetical protein